MISVPQTPKLISKEIVQLPASYHISFDTEDVLMPSLITIKLVTIEPLFNENHVYPTSHK